MDSIYPKRVKGELLIAEDDLSALETLENLLSREGYEVRGAQNGQTALLFAKEDPPELILLDIRLPDIEGFQVCRRLKEDPQTASIPVIFISGLDEVEDKVKGLAVGGVDYITKPFQGEELLARVETHLALRRLQQQSEAQNAQLQEEIAKAKRAEEALRKAHDELEERVKERTADLARANLELAASEKALEERLREIEQLKQRLEQENIYLREEINLQHPHEEIVGQSDVMKKVLLKVEQVSQADSTVLIQGETGTGKELLARAIHHLSKRKDRPLVTVNCASLPPTLIESELFGREKGAYTGALTKMVGRFEVADGSTLFLDEIAELPLDLQSKLLRVLEEGKFERLGSTKTLQVDVRIIAATNRDIAQEVKEGRFRKDLYYRLNVFPIAIPPLRERAEDIPLMAWAFVREFQKRMGKEIESIPRRSIDALQSYPWPGNVRELKNVIERAMIVTTGKTLSVQLPKFASSEAEDTPNLEDTERRHIVRVLERTGWRVAGKGGAAEILGLNRSTLLSRMKKLGIKRPAYQ
jgi:DNA-binding NtrC family response regulator